MTLIVDAGTLFAQADADDPEHEAIVTLFEGERGPLVASQVAVAEADYLILTRLGVDVELAFLDDLAAGTFVVDCLDRKELGLARDLACRYRDLELGLADTSLAVLANRRRTDRIASFDERAFRPRASAPKASQAASDRSGSGSLAFSSTLRFDFAIAAA